MNEEIVRDEIQIDLRELVNILIDKLWIATLVFILAAAGTFLVNHYILEKQYESSSSVYIMNRQDEQTLTVSDLQTGTQLTTDYIQLVTSRPVLEEVISKLDLQLDNNKLKKMITVTNPTNTRIIQITVTDNNPETAQLICENVREAAAKQIMDVMEIDTVNVIEKANFSSVPVSPNTMRNTILGGILGAMIAFGIIFLKYIVLDDTIKTDEDVERYLGLGVLAMIPLGETDKKTRNNVRKLKQKVKTKVKTQKK